MSSGNPTTVAVLPFQNAGSDKDTDFLRLALPDEITTTLSYSHALSVRPSATTSKYVGEDLDVQKAGRDMQVTAVVTGHYMKEGRQLQITLEAVNVADNRLIWRDTVVAASLDMIAMREQITAKVRQGLSPALGASAAARALPILAMRKVTTSSCAASPFPMIRRPTGMRSQCWSAPSRQIQPTRRRGTLWACATTTTRPTQAEAKKWCSVLCGAGTVARSRSHLVCFPTRREPRRAPRTAEGLSGCKSPCHALPEECSGALRAGLCPPLCG